MNIARRGDLVRVHYTGQLSDGTVFDTTAGSDPLEFRLGEGHVLGGFDMAVRGMAPGEKKSVHLKAEDAYGRYRSDRVTVVDRSFIPDDVDVSVGRSLELTQADGRINVVTITDISGDVVTLDGNHPLTDKDLHFELELVEIVPSRPKIASPSLN